jgi:hypothetical protein
MGANAEKQTKATTMNLRGTFALFLGRLKVFQSVSANKATGAVDAAPVFAEEQISKATKAL